MKANGKVGARKQTGRKASSSPNTKLKTKIGKKKHNFIAEDKPKNSNKSLNSGRNSERTLIVNGIEE